MSRKLLVAYSLTSTHVQTTLDYLNALKSELGYEVDYLHVTHDALIDLDFDAAGYDIVFNNYCTRFCLDNYVSATYRAALKRFTGLKVMAVQDEYDQTNKLKSAIKEHGFNIVLTCVPQDALEYVYPRADFPNVKFITVFTGYVPDSFVDTFPSPKPLAERPIILGYRGRDIGPRYGRLGFEKFEIGRRMKEICDARGVINDIAMDERSRIYGTAWFDFIGNCRAMLGSESGSNVFDFDGSIAAQLTSMTERLGRTPTHAEFEPFVGKRDKEIDMGQISPRVFECAVLRTPMVLFRGRYSDAIQADTHYIPLELDFSNADEVLKRLNDLEALNAMADRAFQHLVASKNFGYRTNFRNLKDQFEIAISELHGNQKDEMNAVTTEASPSASLIDLRQLALRQMPTSKPEGMNRFNDIQQRVATFAAYSHDGDFDKFVCHSMANALSVINALKSHYDTLPAKHANSASGDISEAVDDLIHQAKEIAHQKSLWQQTRDALVSAASSIDQKADLPDRSKLNTIAVHDVEWSLLYSKLFHEFNSSYLQCRELLTSEILAPADGPRTLVKRWRRIRSRVIVNQAMANGSRIETAKFVVKQVPILRDLATKSLLAIRGKKATHHTQILRCARKVMQVLRR